MIPRRTVTVSKLMGFASVAIRLTIYPHVIPRPAPPRAKAAATAWPPSCRACRLSSAPQRHRCSRAPEVYSARSRRRASRRKHRTSLGPLSAAGRFQLIVSI
jgi:hypothetical protein